MANAEPIYELPEWIRQELLTLNKLTNSNRKPSEYRCNPLTLEPDTSVSTRVPSILFLEKHREAVINHLASGPPRYKVMAGFLASEAPARWGKTYHPLETVKTPWYREGATLHWAQGTVEEEPAMEMVWTSQQVYFNRMMSDRISRYLERFDCSGPNAIRAMLLKDKVAIHREKPVDKVFRWGERSSPNLRIGLVYMARQSFIGGCTWCNTVPRANQDLIQIFGEDGTPRWFKLDQVAFYQSACQQPIEWYRYSGGCNASWRHVLTHDRMRDMSSIMFRSAEIPPVHPNKTSLIKKIY